MNIALIFAGGIGQRFGSHPTPKQFLTLYDKPIIIYTLEKFQNHPEIDHIVVSCVSGWEEKLKEMAEKYNITKLKHVVTGGQTSQESKLNALHKIEEYAPKDAIVLLHDGVRPLIDGDLITRNIECVKKHGNAVTVDPFTETGVVSYDKKTVGSVLDRDKLYIAKAPQSFYLKQLLYAHEQGRSMPETVAIDTCSILSKLGHQIFFVECGSTNIKITRQEDYFIFKALFDFNNSNNKNAE